MLDRKDKLERFLSLGWGETEQSKSIFEFLYNAGSEMTNGDTVVDLGAGECRYEFFFAHANYVAVDFGLGDTTWDYSKLDILGDVANPYFLRDSSVDFCLSTVVLEHLSDPHAFFKHAHRILKPGGKLFLYVPFVAEEHQIPYDFFRYTSYGLKSLASDFASAQVAPTCSALETAFYTFDDTLKRYRFTRKSKMLNFQYKILRKIVKKIIKPIVKKLIPTGKNEAAFPFTWTLIATKEGVPSSSQTNVSVSKSDLINAITQCPVCQSRLIPGTSEYRCTQCEKTYPVKEGIVSFQ